MTSAAYRQAAGATKRERSRAAALRAAVELLEAAGGDRSKVTMAQVASLAGRSPVTVQKCWGTKDRLFDAAEAGHEGLSPGDLDDDGLLAAAVRMRWPETESDVQLLASAAERWSQRAPAAALDLLMRAIKQTPAPARFIAEHATRAEVLAIQLNEPMVAKKALYLWAAAAVELGDTAGCKRALERICLDDTLSGAKGATLRGDAAAFLALLLAAQGSDQEALYWAEESVRFASESGETNELLLRAVSGSELAEALGDAELATRLLAQAPGDGTMPGMRAALLRRQGDLAEARLVELGDEPGDVGSVIDLARCERTVGHMDAAARLLDRAEVDLQTTIADHPEADPSVFGFWRLRLAREREVLRGMPKPQSIGSSVANRAITSMQDVVNRMRSGQVLGDVFEQQVFELAIELAGRTKAIPTAWYESTPPDE